ncbi:glycosyltransferase family 2 protein [Paenibacillus alkalitolerans]|uniref:glycosyltransferase family 2 protein n=1 Tax=Paenibacillus alkalitolerans TaxID=2799335 RepID=UPI0018F36B84|nr:glycosyltransferase family 2 protein [Paenibacillus alkalitolerans]
MPPMVSVIIPTFNRHHALAELLEALLRQTFQDFEIIIVNDAGEPADGVAALYPELDIRVIDLPVNSYHVWARNAAIPHVRGEYIMPIDDDDLIVPDHMEHMAEQIDGADLAYSDVEIFDYIVRDGVRLPTARFLFAYEHDPALIRQFNTYVASGSLYRRELHDELGPFDVEVRNYWDWDWILRVMEGHRVKKVPRAGTLYAFAAKGGDNQSGKQDVMRKYLDRLCVKHRLGQLPTKNFFLMLEEEQIRSRRSASEIVWDGKPIVSRLVGQALDKW